MRQVHAVRADAVEDVPVALLDGDRQLLLRTGLQIADLLLLMLREVDETIGRLQLQGQPRPHAAPHAVAGVLVGRHEDEMVAQGSQRRTVGALVRVYPLDQLGHLVEGFADGQAVVGEHDELRAAVAHLVRHVERAAGERDGVERLALEDVPRMRWLSCARASAWSTCCSSRRMTTLRLASARNRMGAAGRSSR